MLTSPPQPTAPASSLLHRATTRSALRLLPLLFACYVIAYVDRSNVGYAKLTMQRDLPAFDDAVIGLGSGLFFLGYVLLEIPGSLLVERASARKFLARIMLTWGLVAAATAFVKTPAQFYSARLALGLAEAGFFPGTIVFLTHWFPAQTRARAMSIFLVATPVAQLLAPKICNALLSFGTTDTINSVAVHHPALLGLHGWQWVYIAWGIPAILLAFLVYFTLPDRPRHARWLTPEERDALETALAEERAALTTTPSSHTSLRAILTAFRHPATLALTAVLFSISASNYALETFLPSLLRDWYHLDRDHVTTLLLLPPLVALAALLLAGYTSDRSRDRLGHTAFLTFLAALGLGLTPLSLGVLSLTLLCTMAYAAGNKGSQPPFWALPSLLLPPGPAAAAATGAINSLGNLGGFLGPFALGALSRHTGSFTPGLYLLASLLALCSLIPLLLRSRKSERQPTPTPRHE